MNTFPPKAAQLESSFTTQNEQKALVPAVSISDFL